MRTATIILGVFILAFSVTAQEIRLPDGNVVQGGGAQSASQTLPPPPAPPAPPVGSQTPAPGAGDDVAARAAAAMKQLGADPAKNPELFEKLVTLFQQKSQETGAQAGSSVVQGAQGTQDGQAASRPSTAATVAQLTQQGQGAQLQQGQGVAQTQQLQGSAQPITETSSVTSGYSTCGSCSTQYTSYVVVRPPIYVETYRPVYTCSYPVYRSYPTFRGFVSINSGRRLIGRR